MTPTSRRARAALCALAATLSVLFAAPLAEANRSRRSNTIARRSAAVTQLQPEERRQLAMERVLRGGGVRRCWARQLYRDPSTATRRLVVSVAVDREGRVTRVMVRDNMAPALASCIAATGFVVAPVGPGDPFEAQGTLTLERGD